MKNIYVLGLCVVPFFLASGSSYAGSGYFYKDNNYKGGDPYIVSSGTEKSGLGGWNDKISSYKIDSGVQCVITKNSKFGGGHLYITGSASSMPSGWNDKVSSISCQESDYFTTNLAPANTCYAYEHNHFSGNMLNIKVDRNKSSLGSMNDRISSIRVGSGIKCEFYKDSKYKNKLFSMTGEQNADLSNSNNDKISSIKCYTYQP